MPTRCRASPFLPHPFSTSLSCLSSCSGAHLFSHGAKRPPLIAFHFISACSRVPSTPLNILSFSFHAGSKPQSPRKHRGLSFLLDTLQIMYLSWLHGTAQCRASPTLFHAFWRDDPPLPSSLHVSGRLSKVPVSPCPDCFCSQFFQYALFILIIFVTSAAITASGVAVPFESSPSKQGLQLSSLYTRARPSLQPFPKSIKQVSYSSWQGHLPCQASSSDLLQTMKSKCKISIHFAVLKPISPSLCLAMDETASTMLSWRRSREDSCPSGAPLGRSSRTL